METFTCPQGCQCVFNRIAGVWKGWKHFRHKNYLYHQSTGKTPPASSNPFAPLLSPLALILPEEPTSPSVNSVRIRAGVFAYDPVSKKILVVQTNGHFYGLPKGGIEPGETIKQCAIRELLEETGISILEEMLADSTVIQNGYHIFYLELDSNLEIYHPKIVENEDATGSGWVTVDCLFSFYLQYGIITSHLRKAILIYLGDLTVDQLDQIEDYERQSQSRSKSMPKTYL